MYVGMCVCMTSRMDFPFSFSDSCPTYQNANNQFFIFVSGFLLLTLLLSFCTLLQRILYVCVLKINTWVYIWEVWGKLYLVVL